MHISNFERASIGLRSQILQETAKNSLFETYAQNPFNNHAKENHLLDKQELTDRLINYGYLDPPADEKEKKLKNNTASTFVSERARNLLLAETILATSDEIAVWSVSAKPTERETFNYCFDQNENNQLAFSIHYDKEHGKTFAQWNNTTNLVLESVSHPSSFGFVIQSFYTRPDEDSPTIDIQLPSLIKNSQFIQYGDVMPLERAYLINSAKQNPSNVIIDFDNLDDSLEIRFNKSKLHIQSNHDNLQFSIISRNNTRKLSFQETMDWLDTMQVTQYAPAKYARNVLETFYKTDDLIPTITKPTQQSSFEL